MYIHINTQVRVLMYLKFNAKLSQLTDTFVNIAGTLLQFLVIWFVNLCAFVLMAHLECMRWRHPPRRACDDTPRERSHA